jgi:hypothetical protein
MSAPIVVFAREVKAGLELQREPPPLPPPVVVAKVDDAAKKADLTPAPKDEPVAIARPASSGVPRAVPWALAGGAVAAASGSVVLGLLGAGDKATFNDSLVVLPDGAQGTTLSENDAKVLAASANTKIGLAVGSAVLSAALGGAAAYLFVRD